jgi:DNA-binding NarL/FixJ family response regulator
VYIDCRLVMNCVIVDDQVILAELLAENLSTLPGLSVAAIAHRVQDGTSLCRELAPDLLIVDLLLPDGSGVEVAEVLLEENPEAKVILLSDDHVRQVSFLHLRDAILGVIQKNELLEILRYQILALLKHRQDAGGDPDASGSVSARPLRDWERLTRREQDVFVLIGQGLTTEAIADTLGISLLTAQTHRKHITSKLGIKGAELVLRAFSHKPADEAQADWVAV